jgi:hypothetical protein
MSHALHPALQILIALSSLALLIWPIFVDEEDLDASNFDSHDFDSHSHSMRP